MKSYSKRFNAFSGTHFHNFRLPYFNKWDIRLYKSKIHSIFINIHSKLKPDFKV